MTFLREKGEFNISAAELLYNYTYFAPSIHCAYYSCFQLLKFLIKDKLKIDYSQQDKEIGSSPQASHAYVWSKVYGYLCSKEKDQYKLREIRTKYKELQLLRVRSDYQNMQIDEGGSRQAIQYSQELRKYFRDTIT